jgi:hypothetical protein
MCISTVGCSALKFDEETGACDLGSKVLLLPPKSSDKNQILLNVTINPVGKNIKNTYLKKLSQLK